MTSTIFTVLGPAILAAFGWLVALMINRYLKKKDERKAETKRQKLADEKEIEDIKKDIAKLKNVIDNMEEMLSTREIEKREFLELKGTVNSMLINLVNILNLKIK